MLRNHFLGLLLLSLSPWIFLIIIDFLPDTTYYNEYAGIVGVCLGSFAGGILGGQILHQKVKKVFIVNIFFYTIMLPLLIALGVLITTRISDLIGLLKHSFLDLFIILIRIELMLMIILMVQYIGIWCTRNPSKGLPVIDTENKD